MANEMIKFYRGLVNSLPTAGDNGALYITTDEGAIYYGTGTGMKRLGDFVQVANVASLPEKAHESCLYYCVAENILAKWNGTEWKQINKQPTSEELKTLLGLGALAYKSEVVEGDLSAALKEKVNAAAEGNHSHANKALLDTYTQTEADLADAVAKKHAHANADELAKIVDGDKAKWDAVAADHLTSADKTTLENSIKEAKKAGTDANTALETYKVSNDARVLAVEEDIAEIVDGTNGILAQAKSYSDGKLATARTEITAEIDADVKVVADELAGYKSSNDTALAGVKATADAAAVKTEVETALAGKVDKVEGKSLISDTEIARLANVTNYDDTQVKADIAKKADSATMTTELGKKVDKVDGKDLIATSEIERLATLKNYDDTALVGRVTNAEGKITDLETASAKHALKTEVEAVDAKFADYTKTVDLPTDLGDFTNNAGYAKTADVNVELDKKADKTQVATDIADAIAPLATTEALNGVKAIAEAARTEDEVNSQIDTKISALNLATTYEPIGAEDRAKAYVDGKFTDANLGQYTTEQDVKDIVDGVISAAADDETYNSLTKLIDYVDTHKGEAIDMAEDIADHETRIGVLEAKPAAGITATQISNWDGEVGAKALAETKLDASVFTEYSNAHAGDYTNKQIDDAIDADVKAAIDAEVLRANGAYDAKGAAADAQAAAEATAAGALASARTEITTEIGTAISGEVSRADAKYEEKGVAQGIVDDLKLDETYEPIGAETRAIAAAKTETETQVKALADGQVTTNKNDIASLFEQMQWGEF